MKILLVEDDLPTCEFLKSVLTTHRYVVDIATDGQIGFEMASQLQYDLIILDVLIPKFDGVSICRRLRREQCQVPILMLTAKSGDEDVTTGLDSGADDYVVKPCTQAQLMARIRALLRRKQQESDHSILRWGDLALDVHLLQVTYKSQNVQLSPKQHALLELFLRNPQRIFSRDAIIDHLWSIDDYPSHAAVTNLVKDLRQRLKAAGMHEECIDTVFGLGYRLNSLPSSKPQPVATSPAVETQPEKLNRENLGILEMEEVTQHFRESSQQRLQFLEGIARSLQTHPLSSEQLVQASLEAHRLVGAMGTFGYDRGSELARNLEILLGREKPFSKQDISQMSDLVVCLQQELTLSAPGLADASPNAAYLEKSMAHSNFEMLLLTEWQRARVSHTRLALLCLAMGHTDADALSAPLPSIQELTQFLQESIQPTDGLTYWGDWQWMILLPNTDIDGALRVGRWIRRAIATTFPALCPLTLGGTSTLPQEAQALQSFIKTAEQAMAIAKQQTSETDCFLAFA